MAALDTLKIEQFTGKFNKAYARIGGALRTIEFRYQEIKYFRVRNKAKDSITCIYSFPSIYRHNDRFYRKYHIRGITCFLEVDMQCVIHHGDQRFTFVLVEIGDRSLLQYADKVGTPVPVSLPHFSRHQNANPRLNHYSQLSDHQLVISTDSKCATFNLPHNSRVYNKLLGVCNFEKTAGYYGYPSAAHLEFHQPLYATVADKLIPVIFEILQKGGVLMLQEVCSAFLQILCHTASKMKIEWNFVLGGDCAIMFSQTHHKLLHHQSQELIDRWNATQERVIGVRAVLQNRSTGEQQTYISLHLSFQHGIHSLKFISEIASKEDIIGGDFNLTLAEILPEICGLELQLMSAEPWDKAIDHVFKVIGTQTKCKYSSDSVRWISDEGIGNNINAQ